MANKKLISAALIVITLIAGASFYYYQSPKPQESQSAGLPQNTQDSPSTQSSDQSSEVSTHALSETADPAGTPKALTEPANPNSQPPQSEEIKAAKNSHVPVSTQTVGSQTLGEMSTGSPDRCIKVTFQSKAKGNKVNLEEWSTQANELALPHSNFSKTSLCVRVNGTPVKFTRMKDQPSLVLIGAVAGPNAEITAQYCIGKAKCQDNCSIPKDEFMDALGAGEDSNEDISYAAWTKDKPSEKGKKVEKDLDHEMAEMKGVLFGEATGKMRVYKGWINQGERPACEKQTGSTKNSHASKSDS